MLGEHRELHGLWNILTKHSDKGVYSKHPETLRWLGKLRALYNRHEEIIIEDDDILIEKLQIDNITHESLRALIELKKNVNFRVIFFMNNNNTVCPTCHQPILKKYYFCPNCGNNLKEKLLPISALTQIGFYALAIFLPPLGLWPGIKYVMKNNPHAKRVGAITIVLTLISSALTIWAIFALFNNYIGQLNEVLYLF